MLPTIVTWCYIAIMLATTFQINNSRWLIDPENVKTNKFDLKQNKSLVIYELAEM